ncbi:sulfotransferase family protein [Crocosphaera chwakensis]|nr:sulfotransferase [Crocosphaera chwakensis]
MNSNPFIISKPTFLVGAERSGTTLLRLMLSHHPRLAWSSEFEYVVDKITDNGDFPDLNQYYEWLETLLIFQDVSFLTIDPELDYIQLVNSFLWQWKNHYRKELVGATVHRHFDRLLKIWPDANFIYLIRDARDVARSCIGMGWSGNVWKGLDRWLEAEYLWDQLKSQLSTDRYIEITYENLITDPVTTLTKICHFLTLEYDQNMLNYAGDTTYSKPDPKLIKQWRHKLSDYEIRLVESRASALLKDRGYELSGLPPLDVTPFMEKQINLQDWWFRIQFRINRYGLSLVLADYVARKLNIKPWQKQTQKQLIDIQMQYLK